MNPSKKLVAFKIFLLLFIGCAVYAAYTYAQSVPALKKQIDLATVRNPETLTELYFENHTALPGFVELDREYPYAFTIHNLEYRDMNYRYRIYLDVDGKHLPITEGRVFIKDGEKKTIRETLLQRTQKGRVKVVVELTDLHQQIDFWIQTI